MMKLTYDASVDALYIRWNDADIENTRELEDDVMLDLDQNGNAVGIEILDASKRIQYLSPELSAKLLQPETETAQAA